MSSRLFTSLADLVVLIHLAYVVFVVLGGLLVRRRPYLAWLHLPAVLWGAVVELCGWLCPLTPLEQWLRLKSGAAPYKGDFVEQYLLPLLYPAGLTRGHQIILGLLVIMVNLVIYYQLWHALKKRP